MLLRPVAELECLWPCPRELPIGRPRSSLMVLEGEPGEGGVLDCEDFGEVRAERDQELNLLGLLGVGVRRDGCGGTCVSSTGL